MELHFFPLFPTFFFNFHSFFSFFHFLFHFFHFFFFCIFSLFYLVEYTFIQNRFHPLTLSSKHDFMRFPFVGPNSPWTPTMVSPLKRDGSACPRSATVDGAALARARQRKEATYPELAGRFGRSRSVVLACEVGGRWSEECQDFLRQLARSHFGSSHFQTSLCSRERRGFCLLGIFRSITVCDAKFETMAAEWQSSGVEHPRKPSAPGMVTRVARSSPPFSAVASSRSSAVSLVWDSSEAASAEERRDSVPEDFRVDTIPKSSCQGGSCQAESVKVGAGIGSVGRHRRTRGRRAPFSVGPCQRADEGSTSRRSSEGRRTISAQGQSPSCRDQQSARYDRIEHRGHRGSIGAIEGGGGDGSSAGTGASTGMGHRGSKVARGVGTGAQSSRRSHKSPHPELRRGRKLFGGEGCQTSCRVRRAHSHQPTRCGRVVIRETSGAPRCNRDGGQRVNFGSDRSDSERSGTMSQFAVHSQQHGGVVRPTSVGVVAWGSHQPRAKSTSMQKASGRSGCGTPIECNSS